LFGRLAGNFAIVTALVPSQTARLLYPKMMHVTKVVRNQRGDRMG